MLQLKNVVRAALVALTMMSGAAKAADIFVVTSAENKQALAMDDVKQIFKGDSHKWASGKNIVLAVPDLGSPEGEMMLSKIYEISAKDYKKFWMQKVFKGEATSPPENKNGDSMKQFLKAYPDAIGILPANEIDASLRKVLKLD